MKKSIIAICAMLISISAIAQQDAMYTHYMFNMQDYNPAYVGSRGVMSVTGMHRSQWVNLDGAPRSQVLSFQSPVITDKIAAGFGISNDKIGPTSNFALAGDVAYRLKISEESVLSFGAKLTANIYQGNFADVNVNDGTDDAFAASMKSKFTPNIGFGAYYTAKNYYAGFSIPRFAQRRVFEKGEGKDATLTLKRHYYLSGGAIYDINQEFKIRPSALVKITTGAPIQLDLTASVVYHDIAWLGASYRTGDAFGLLLGANAMPGMQIGYSYDFSVGIKNGLGSHEIFVRYDLIGKDASKIVNQKYF